jgi:hypothetical protein
MFHRLLNGASFSSGAAGVSAAPVLLMLVIVVAPSKVGSEGSSFWKRLLGTQHHSDKSATFANESSLALNGRVDPGSD